MRWGEGGGGGGGGGHSDKANRKVEGEKGEAEGWSFRTI